MPALIVVNQATRPAGVAGKARSDGVASQLVTCTNNTVEGSYLWTLVDVPIRSALVRGTTGTAASFTFTPDVKGTYTVSLRVNGSSAPGDNDVTYLAIRTSGGKTLGWRYQAAGETTEDNEAYAGLGFPGNTNVRGWATNEDLIYEEVEEGVWETQNAIVTFGGLIQRIVMTDPATGKVNPSLIAGSTPTGPAGGDLAGTYPNPSVVALRGRALSSTWAPADGQVFWWNTGANEFQLSSDILTQATGVTAKLQDGADVAPSLYWKTDTDTGFYHPGVDSIGLTSGGQYVAKFKRPITSAVLSQATFDLVSDVGGITGTAGYDTIRVDVQGAASGSGILRLMKLTDNGSDRFHIMGDGRVRIVSGSVGSPALSFLVDTTSGLYMQSAGKWSIVNNGAAYISFDSTSITNSKATYFPDGLVGAPSISLTSDPDTGFYSIAGNSLGITTGGVLRLAVSTSGIDATVPYRAPTASAANPSYEFQADLTTGMYLIAAGVLGFSVSGVEKVRFNTGNGLAGINWLPSVDNTYTLGDPSFRWSALWAATASFTTGLFGDGLVGTPSISFSADQDTGFYRVGSGSIGVSGDGLQVVRFQAVGGANPQIIAGSGASNAPVYTFAGDQGTGMYRPGANQISMVSALTEIARFQAPAGVPQVLLPNGALATPSFAWSADTDTGLMNGQPLGATAGTAMIVSGAFAAAAVHNGTNTQFAVAQGSAAAPGLAVDNFDTGFWAPSNRVVAAGATGVEIFRFQNPSGTAPQVLLQHGSLATPVLAWASDPSVGWYFTTAGWAFGTGGGQSMIIDDEAVKTIQLQPLANNAHLLGVDALRWAEVHATQYFAANGSGSAGGPCVPAYGFSDSDSSAGMIYATTGITGPAMTGGNGIICTFADDWGVIPYTDLRFELGSPTQRWATLYVGHVYADDASYSFTADTDTSIGRASSGVITVTGDALEVVRFSAPAGVNPQVLAASGTLAKPVYAFTAETNTGMYRAAANEMAFGVAGTRIATWTGQGLMMTATGIASAPGIYFAGSTTTGIYQGGTNQIAISASGTTIANIMSTGIELNPQIRVADGSAGTPGYAFIGQVNTGFYRSGSGTTMYTAAGTPTWSLGTNITGQISTQSIAPLANNYINLGGSTTTATVSPFIVQNSTNFSATSGAQWGFEILPSIVQNASTASFTALGLFMTGNAGAGSPTFGSGGGAFIKMTSGGTLQSTIDSGGNYFAGGSTGGSAATPAYGFQTGGDAGMYRSNSKQLGFATDGTLRVTIDSTSVTSTVPFYAPNGTAAAPSHTFSGDPDTGIYYAGTNQLGLSAGGSLRANVTTTQFLTTVPVVAGGGAVGTPAISINGDSDTGLYSIADGDLGFSTNGTLRFDISTTAITSTLPYLAPDGSAGAPSYSFSTAGNSDTGFYRAGTDTIGVSASSTAVWTFASTVATANTVVEMASAAMGTTSASSVRVGVPNTAGRPKFLAMKDPDFGEIFAGTAWHDRQRYFLTTSGATTMHAVGMQLSTSGTTLGYVTATGTSYMTASQRNQFTTAATTSTVAEIHSTTPIVAQGNSTTQLGFLFHARFSVGSNYNTNTRFLVGLTNLSTAIGGATDPGANAPGAFPNTTAMIGVGASSGSATLNVYTNDGGGQPQTTSTGLTISASDVFDVWIWSAPNSTTRNVFVNRLNSAGTYSGSSFNFPPGANVWLYPHSWIATSENVAKTLNVHRWAIESGN